MPISRRRGVPGGLLIALLGLWAALIPFVGPYFDFEFGSDETWKWTTDRLWLDVIPGAVAFLGGLILIRATTRAGGSAGAWLALLAGLWLIVGPTVSTLWNDGVVATGQPFGSDFRQALEWIGFFYGAGGLLTLFSAYEMGFLAALPVVDRAAAVSSPQEPRAGSPRRRWLPRWPGRRTQPTA